MKYLVTFHTHSGAIKFRREIKKNKLEIILKPVPRKISSNCGVAGSIETSVNLLNYILPCVEEVYDVTDGTYNKIYESE